MKADLLKTDQYTYFIIVSFEGNHLENNRIPLSQSQLKNKPLLPIRIIKNI